MTGKKKVDFNYVNRAMKHLPNYSEKKLVCITNGKEVLRVSRKNAKKYFFKKVSTDKKTLAIKRRLGFEVNINEGFYYQRVNSWFYTTKSIYKQYTESLKPGSKIPKPKFSQKIMNKNGEEKVVNIHIFQ